MHEDLANRIALGSSTRRRLLAGGLAAAGIGLPSLLSAQSTYPSRPIRMIIAFAAGGGNDRIGRMLADWLSVRLGQPVVVENRTGAGGNIGAEAAAKSEPDGYTLFFGTNGTQSMNQLIFKSMPYDTDTAFANICDVIRVANIITVADSFEPRTTAALADYVKRHPGKVSAGNSGIGSMSHLGLELFSSMVGARMNLVPYRGSAPVLADLVAGSLQVAQTELSTAKPLIQAGKVHAIGVTSKERSPALPDVPAIAEALPGYEATSWQVLVAAAGTPRPIIDRLNRLTNDFLKDGEILRKFGEMGVDPTGGTPEDLDRFVRAETTKWRKIVADAGITLQ
ncbi:MAG: Bug family tripartite tricarboxylate transporter substrate binding protein [Geminicoccaceae bacterium]